MPRLFSILVLFTIIYSLSCSLAVGAREARQGAGTLSLTEAEKAWLEEHQVIKVRISKNYPPFEFYQDGRYQGIAVDYLAVLGEKLGVRFEPSADMSWPDALESIRRQNGAVDMVLVITYDPERESFLNFTNDYINFPGVIFTRKDGDFVSGVSDLSGLKISMEKGYIDAEYIRRELSDVSFYEVETTEEALLAVSTGKAEAYMGNVAVGTYFIDTLGLVNLKVAAPASYSEDPYSMGVRKDWPELAVILEKGISSLTEAEKREIRNKWLTVRYEYGIHVFDIVKWVVVATLICLAFIVQLRRMVRSRTGELQAMHDNLEGLVDERTSELRNAQDKLLAQERLATLGQLTATVSHELRNPLGTINNALNNIKNALEVGDKNLVMKSIEVSGRNIQRCDRIVGELLDYGRKAKTVFFSVDIDKMVLEILENLTWDENIILDKDIGSNAVIIGDEDRLRRAVLNLLANAQQALESSEQPEKKVHLATRQADDFVEISIEDNGPGIPAELREKIFEPLFSTKNFGIGLGMTIVRDIVELHQGSIRLEEAEGGGCRFILSLPLSKNVETGESYA